MDKYNYKFVVINEMPINNNSADNLSIQMSRDFGREGWELVSVTTIPLSSPPGMLLTFQKKISPGG
jgi:hypothetical protein